MTRRSREVGIIKSCVLGAAFAVALAMPAHAENKINLSATAAFTTDYVFRGITQTAENPASQPGFDLTYGIFYAGIWGSNLDFGGSPFSSDIASIKIDYYAGLTPMWKGITFNIAASTTPIRAPSIRGRSSIISSSKTGASYTFAKKLTVGVTNYWSPEFTGETGDADALELSAAYAFSGDLQLLLAQHQRLDRLAVGGRA
jgi:uncharacterized protein (TIGR02001 family)